MVDTVSENNTSVIQQAKELASATLRANYKEIQTSPDSTTKVIVAGQQNFQELWARDACFAMLGANRVKDFDVVKSTLSLLFSHQRDDGMIPRRLSALSNKKRTLGILLGKNYFDPTAVVSPEFETGHHTTPLDQNALVVIALVDYVVNSGNKIYGENSYPNAERALQWLASWHHDNDLLLAQEAYADWIDLVKRKGKSLYTNVCYYKALVGMSLLAHVLGKEEDVEKYRIIAQAVKESINKLFWMEDKGYYRNTDTLDNFESSGNMLAIVFDVADQLQADRIFDRIGHTGLDIGMPLKTVDRSYPFWQIAFDTRLLGWSRYQNGYSWSWIGNMYLVALQKTGRQEMAKQHLERISKIVVRDNGFFEVYDTNVPVKSLTYASEAGFSWAAGTFLYACEKLGMK